MGRTALLPALAFVATIGAALLSLDASLRYLGQATYDVVGAATATTTDARRPAFLDTIDPLPSGSINAVAPLPRGPVVAAPPATPTALATPAPTTEAVPPPDTATAAVTAPGPDPAASQPRPALTGPAPGQSQVIVTSSVNVRDRPSNNSRVIGTVRGGARLAVHDEQQGWYRVSGEGGSGWVYRRFLRPAN